MSVSLSPLEQHEQLMQAQANQNNGGQDDQIVDQERDLGPADDIGGDWNDEDDDFGEKDDA